MKCPYCAEDIQDGAAKCKHCGEWLDKSQAPVTPAPVIIQKQGGGCGKAIGWTVLIFIGLSVLGYLVNPDHNASTAPNPLSETTVTAPSTANTSADLQVLDSKVETGQFGNRTIDGNIKNNSNRTYGYAQVEINLYDAAGNQVGSTLANVNNLEPGKIWHFSAGILEDKARSYKIKGITGF